MKRCSASLITREVQIKITMTHHFTYIKMAIIKKKKKKKEEGSRKRTNVCED